MADLHAKFAGCHTGELEFGVPIETVPRVRREPEPWFGAGLRTVRAGECPGCGTSRGLVLVAGHLHIRGHDHEWGFPCTGSGARWCEVPTSRRRNSACECERRRDEGSSVWRRRA